MSAMPEVAAELRLITFTVGPETFVLDIMAVRQIIPYTGSTTLPTAPGFIEGIVILRSEVIPIIDLRARLYPDLREHASEPLILITHSSTGIIGLKVDAVRRIVNVGSDSLLPPPPIARGIRGDRRVGQGFERCDVARRVDRRQMGAHVARRQEGRDGPARRAQGPRLASPVQAHGGAVGERDELGVGRDRDRALEWHGRPAVERGRAVIRGHEHAARSIAVDCLVHRPSMEAARGRPRAGGPPAGSRTGR